MLFPHAPNSLRPVYARASAFHGRSTLERPLDPTKLGDHLDRLFRAAWALCGSREDAEDLVQETYTRVLARPRMLRREDDLGYLLRALRNTFLLQQRTRSRRPRETPMLEDFELESPRSRSAQEVVETREVFAAIAALPDDFRDVLVAVDVTGLSYEETARALKVPVGTVMSRLYRARRQVVRLVES